MQRLVKKIDQNFPLHNSTAPSEEGGMGCGFSERHTNRFGWGERASGILQTERTTSLRVRVCRREETNHLLPPFVLPWSALPVRWTDCGKQCQVNKEISNLFQHYGFTSLNAERLSSPQMWEVCSYHSGVLKIQVFLDVTLCCWVNISWRFERCCYLHHQGQSDDPWKRL